MRKKIEVLKAVSEPNRIRILMLLKKKPLCVCEITSILKLNTSTISSHLSILKNAGFIVDEKEGKWINYKISEEIDEYNSAILEVISNYFSDEPQLLIDLDKIENVNRYSLIQLQTNEKRCK
ncbi:MAG: metalloregulator ArsR/SmtB family transcription factor [Bacteroidota bacterium]